MALTLRRGGLGWLKTNLSRRPIKDVGGERFGKLVVTGFANRIDKRKGAWWDCKCDCGNTREVFYARLISGKADSCGCDAYEERKGEKNHKWSGLDYITGTTYGRILRGARLRSLEFSVSKEYLNDLWKKQGGMCALTGVPLEMEKSHRLGFTASLDRIDNTKGYIEGNVWWLHKVVNIMKYTYSTEEFVEWCRKIVEGYEKINEGTWRGAS